MCFQDMNDMARRLPAMMGVKTPLDQQQQQPQQAAPPPPRDPTAAQAPTAARGEVSTDAPDSTGFASLAIPRTNYAGASKNVASG